MLHVSGATFVASNEYLYLEFGQEWRYQFVFFKFLFEEERVVQTLRLLRRDCERKIWKCPPISFKCMTFIRRIDSEPLSEPYADPHRKCYIYYTLYKFSSLFFPFSVKSHLSEEGSLMKTFSFFVLSAGLKMFWTSNPTYFFFFFLLTLIVCIGCPQMNMDSSR